MRRKEKGGEKEEELRIHIEEGEGRRSDRVKEGNKEKGRGREKKRREW